MSYFCSIVLNITYAQPMTKSASISLPLYAYSTCIALALPYCIGSTVLTGVCIAPYTSDSTHAAMITKAVLLAVAAMATLTVIVVCSGIPCKYQMAPQLSQEVLAGCDTQSASASLHRSPEK
jgi:hypothetical protein